MGSTLIISMKDRFCWKRWAFSGTAPDHYARRGQVVRKGGNKRNGSGKTVDI